MLSGVFVGTNVDTKPWLGSMVDSHTTNIGRTKRTAICFYLVFFKEKTMLCIYSYQAIIDPTLCIQSTFFTAFILKKNSPTKYRAVPQFIYCQGFVGTNVDATSWLGMMRIHATTRKQQLFLLIRPLCFCEHVIYRRPSVHMYNKSIKFVLIKHHEMAVS
jgi:hypothetical protein